MLGAVAPRGGALRPLGPRLSTVSGMLICIGALALPFATLDGTPRSLRLVMLALALFGNRPGIVLLSQ
jgi:hypothetical protein